MDRLVQHLLFCPVAPRNFAASQARETILRGFSLSEDGQASQSGQRMSDGSCLAVDYSSRGAAVLEAALRGGVTAEIEVHYLSGLLKVVGPLEQEVSCRKRLFFSLFAVPIPRPDERGNSADALGAFAVTRRR